MFHALSNPCTTAGRNQSEYEIAFDTCIECLGAFTLTMIRQSPDSKASCAKTEHSSTRAMHTWYIDFPEFADRIRKTDNGTWYELPLSGVGHKSWWFPEDGTAVAC